VFDPRSLDHLFQQCRQTLVIFKQCACVSQESRVHVIRWYCRRDPIDMCCYHFWLIIIANATSPLCSIKAKIGDTRAARRTTARPRLKPTSQSLLRVALGCHICVRPEARVIPIPHEKQRIIALIPTELPALVASAWMRYREGGKTAQDASCRRETFKLRLS